MWGMARRTVHIPDELDDRVQESGTAADSYSSIVQAALREHLDAEEIEA